MTSLRLGLFGHIFQGMSWGLRNFVRGHEWKSSLGPLGLTLLLLHLLVAGSIAGLAVERWLTAESEVLLELQPQASEQQKKEFFSALQSQKFVIASRYTTREELLAGVRAQDPDMVKFLDDFQLENPFADTVSVRLDSPRSEAALTQFAGDAKWSTVVRPNFLNSLQEQQAERGVLSAVLQTVRVCLLSCGLLLLLITLFMVYQTLRARLLAHKEEMFVLRQAGAGFSLLELPFLLEAWYLVSATLVFSLFLAAGLVGLVGFLATQTLGLDLALTAQYLLSALLPLIVVMFALEALALVIVTLAGGLLATMTTR